MPSVLGNRPPCLCLGVPFHVCLSVFLAARLPLQFDVNWDNLEPALERFAQFFICPLISADGVDREVRGGRTARRRQPR